MGYAGKMPKAEGVFVTGKYFFEMVWDTHTVSLDLGLTTNPSSDALLLYKYFSTEIRLKH